jgi:hypothetical protein
MIRTLDVNQVGSIVRHEALTQEQSERCLSVYKRIGRFLGDPFENFEAGFLCDNSPDRELLVWETMASAFEMAKPKDEDRVAVARLLLWLSIQNQLPRTSEWSLSGLVIDRVVLAWQFAKQVTGITNTLVTVERID